MGVALAGRLAATSQMVYLKDTATGLTTFQAVAADTQGNMFVAGTVSTGATGTNLIGPRGGPSDVKVMKLNGAGQVVWSTIIGGTGTDIARGIAVQNFQIFVAVETFSTDFPQAASNSGKGMVIRLSPNGATLSFAAKLPGAGAPLNVFADANLNTYIMGETIDNTFPQVNQIAPPTQEAPDVYFAKLDANGAIALSGVYADLGTSPLIRDFAASAQGFWMIDQSLSLRRIDAFGVRDTFGVSISASAVATDGFGDAYVASGGRVVKISRATTAPAYDVNTGVLGPQSIAVNANGEAVVAYKTFQSLSIVNGISGTGPGTSDNYVLRLNALGSVVGFASYVNLPLGSTTPRAVANSQGIFFAVNGSHVARVVEQAADVKVEGLNRFKVGNESHIVVRVTNSGPDTTTSGFQASLPGQPVSVTTTSGLCSIGATGVVSCNAVFLGSGAVRTIEMAVIPPASGNLDPTPMANSSTLDPNLSNNVISFPFLP